MKRFLHRWRLWLLLAAVLSAVGATMAWGLVRERHRIEELEVERLTSQSNVIEANLTRQLLAINLALKSIQAALSGWQQGAGGQIEGLRTLSAMEAAMPAVRTLVVTDSQGVVTLSNREELLGFNAFQRDYVQMPLKALDPALLYVSPSYLTELNNPVLNNRTINLTRVMLNGQGRFAGVVSASIDPQDVRILLNSVRYAPDMRTRLALGSGKIFISEPEPAVTTETDLSPEAASLNLHLSSRVADSHFSSVVAATVQTRLSVTHTLQPAALNMDSPLMVIIDRDLGDLLRPWRAEVTRQAAVYAVLVVLSGFGLLVLQRQRAQKIVAAKRLKLATEASGVGIWEFDLVTKRYHWDAAMFELFNLDPQSMGPRNEDWRSLLSSVDLKRMRDATRITIQKDQPFALTFEVNCRDGSTRFLRNRAALHADDAGVPRRIIGTTENVTERKRRESELRVAAAAFDSHESMLVTNARVEILRVNKAFCALFGYEASEVIGHHPKLLKSGRHDTDFYNRMWVELRQHHTWQGEIRNVRKGGDEFFCWLSISAVCDEDGVVTHYVATHTDITLRKATEEEVRHLAFHDPLTNLPNRSLLADRVQQAVTIARRDKGHLALMFLDLDKFKPVNDRYGHRAGDLLLQAVALRLRTCVRESDTVARVGGDEFVVLLSTIVDAQDALVVAEKVHGSLKRVFTLPDGVEVCISSCTGIALYPEHGTDEAALYHNADVAMYAAKASGRDRYVVFKHDAINS